MISNDSQRMMGVVFIRGHGTGGLKHWKRRYMDCDSETQRIRLFANDQNFVPKTTLLVSDIISVERTQQIKADKDKGFHFTIWCAGRKTLKLKSLHKEERDAWLAFLAQLMCDIQKEKQTETALSSLQSYLATLKGNTQYLVDTHSFFALIGVAAEAAFAELRRGQWLDSLKDIVGGHMYLPVKTVEVRCDENGVSYYDNAGQSLVFCVVVEQNAQNGVVELSYADASVIREILSNHPWKSALQNKFVNTHQDIISTISAGLGGTLVLLDFAPDVTHTPALETYLTDVVSVQYMQVIVAALHNARKEISEAMGAARVETQNLSTISQLSVRIDVHNIETGKRPDVHMRRLALPGQDNLYAKRFLNALTITNPDDGVPGPGMFKVHNNSLVSMSLGVESLATLSNSIVELWYSLAVVDRLLAFEDTMKSEFCLESLAKVRWEQLSRALCDLQIERPKRILAALHVCEVYEKRLRECKVRGWAIRNLLLHFSTLNDVSQLYQAVSITRGGKLQETVFLTNNSNHNFVELPRYVEQGDIPLTNVGLVFAIRDLCVWCMGYVAAQQDNAYDIDEDETASEGGASSANPTEAMSEGELLGVMTPHNEGGARSHGRLPLHPGEGPHDFLASGVVLDQIRSEIEKGFPCRITAKDVALVTKEGLSKLQRIFQNYSSSGARGVLPAMAMDTVVQRFIEFEHRDVGRLEQRASQAARDTASGEGSSAVVQFLHAARAILPIIVPREVVQSVASRRDVLLCGLEHVGKTTLINEMKGRMEERTEKTVGYSSEIVFSGNLNIRFTEIGGAPQQREKWHYVFKWIETVDIIMFMVDSSSRDTDEARHYLKDILYSNKVKAGVPLVLIINTVGRSKEPEPAPRILAYTFANKLKLSKYCAVHGRTFTVFTTHSTPGTLPTPQAMGEIQQILEFFQQKLARPTDVPRRVTPAAVEQ